MTASEYRSVRDTMTPEPRTIDGLASVSQAIQIMRDNEIGYLVIDRRHEGDEFGVVVIHDIAEKVIAQGRAPDRVSVYEIMSKPAVTVDADMNIKYALRLLTRFSLPCALVMEKGRLIGIATLRDMVLRSGAHETQG